jgi:predicted RNase H-like nuclease (RuvC/YqgF family)
VGPEYESMRKEDIANIAKMGQQIADLRGDVMEIKENMHRDNIEKQTEMYVTSIKELSERHHTKEEIGLMMQTRDHQQQVQDRDILRETKRIDTHDQQIAKLERKWAWLAGGGVIIVTLLGIGEAVLKALRW